MVHISDRWAHDHIDDLQSAFFNGAGFESWRISGHLESNDSARCRISAAHCTIERAYAPLLNSQQWEPHTYMQRFGVFGSKWPGSRRRCGRS